MKIQKIIKTRSLILRPPTIKDAQTIFVAYTQDPIVTRHVSWKTHQSIHESRQYIKDCIKAWKGNTRYIWIITKKYGKEVIGTIDLRYVESRTLTPMADVGYVIKHSEWNKGYITEALRAVMGLAFSHLKIHRFWAICDVDNQASARVMEKAGMVREGRLRKYTFHPNIDNKPCDVYLYAKIQ